MSEHAPGIYFGLPESDYHADPALSSTGFKYLLTNPTDWWWNSPYNELREDTDTDAKSLGSAVHKLVLEGRSAFENEYAPALLRSSYPDALVTVDDIKDALKETGLPVPGKKDDLIDRLREAGIETPVWGEIKDAYEARHSGKTILSPDRLARVEIAAAHITNNPSLAPAFTGGHPEVSVFWERDGLRFKARFDYLKPRAVVDLKTFSKRDGMTFQKAVSLAISNYRYDIQAAHYLDARDQVAGLCADGAVFGDHDEDWLEKVSASENTFVWVFQKTNGSPDARGFQFDRGTLVHGCATRDIQTAIENYRAYTERFGTEMWVNTDPIHIMHDTDYPAWLGTD